MTIDIRGIPDDPALRARVTARLSAVLGRLTARAPAAHVTFFDENGPKGGIAIRCALTARLPPRRIIRVEHVADTHRSAFEGSVATLERRLAEDLERAREERRHPKKYFVAKQAWATGSKSTTEPARNTRGRR